MDILKNDFEKEAFNGVGVEIDLDCLETDQAEVVKSGDVRDIEYMTLVKIPYSVGFNTSHEKKNPTKICFSDKVNKEEIVDYIPALIFMIKETANYNRHCEAYDLYDQIINANEGMWIDYYNIVLFSVEHKALLYAISFVAKYCCSKEGKSKCLNI